MADETCDDCRNWSEMIAQSTGGGDVEAMCLSERGPRKMTYTKGHESCAGFKGGRKYEGAVDDPAYLSREV